MHALQTPVGQLVAERPERARLFEEFDIDYCCGGKRTLNEACLRRGIEPGQLVRRLESLDAASPAPRLDWQTRPLADLCDYIVATHHEYLRGELPRLHALLAKIVRVHGERHPELAQVLGVFEPFQRELEHHMFKEERVLFPLIKQLAAAETASNPSVFAVIHVMESEHDQTGQALAEMRQLTDSYQLPADGCTTYRVAFAAMQRMEEDTHQHIHLENNVLFPRLERLFARQNGVAQ